jgi:hypothetical protein
MLTLVRDGLHPMLAIELARRGRVWGEFNAATLRDPRRPHALARSTGRASPGSMAS